MIERESTKRKTVPVRTIIAAIAMLTGVALMGVGYSRNEQEMMYIGITITLGGVLTEAIIGILEGPGKRRRGRIDRA